MEEPPPTPSAPSAAAAQLPGRVVASDIPSATPIPPTADQGAALVQGLQLWLRTERRADTTVVAAISLSLILAPQLVANEVVGFGPSILVSAALAALIGIVWWLIPVATRRRD